MKTRGLEHFSHENRHREQGLVSREKRRRWGHLTMIFQYLKGAGARQSFLDGR